MKSKKKSKKKKPKFYQYGYLGSQHPILGLRQHS